MHPTAFFPIFLGLMVYACRGRHQWMMATIVGSFLQGATPILITAGGRLSGLQTAYGLIPIGIFYFIVDAYAAKGKPPRRLGISAPLAFAAALALISICGAILLPRLFKGEVHVLPPNVGYRETLLRPSGGNLIQAFYAACNFVLFYLLFDYLVRVPLSAASCLRAFTTGAWMAVIIGVYQVAASVVHLPWPDLIINSNLGVGQHYSQGAYGFVRMSSTFLEPSFLALHFLALFALFSIQPGKRLLPALLLMCLVISTSATAAAGLILFGAIWTLIELPRLNIRTISLLMIVGGLLLGSLLAVYMASGKLLGIDAITAKLASHSGSYRTLADRVTIKTFLDSWGLGVGVGSTRSSSFLVTFAASDGVPGLICLGSFLYIVISRSLRSVSAESRSWGFALIAFLLAWIIGVPDMAIPMVWLLSALACATADPPRRSAPVVEPGALAQSA
jgi:hypothetical protein